MVVLKNKALLSTAQATFPGDNGRIAFASDRPGGPAANDYEITPHSAIDTNAKG